MESKDVKDVAEVLTKSLNDTQKNATDTEKLVQQVCSMSGQDSHKQVITGIIADENTDWEKKVDLIQKANAEFDQRAENNTQRVINLQSTQTQNVGTATSWWANNWGVDSCSRWSGSDWGRHPRRQEGHIHRDKVSAYSLRQRMPSEFKLPELRGHFL